MTEKIGPDEEKSDFAFLAFLVLYYINKACVRLLSVEAHMYTLCTVCVSCKDHISWGFSFRGFSGSLEISIISSHLQVF